MQENIPPNGGADNAPDESAALEAISKQIADAQRLFQEQMLQMQAQFSQALTPLQKQAEEIRTRQMRREEERRRVKEEEQRLEAERRRQEAEERERTKPITLEVQDFYRGTVYVRVSEYRKDVVDFFKTFPSRQYDGYRNQISLQDWPGLVERAALLPNVTVAYQDGYEEAIHEILTQPTWLVTRTGDRRLMFKPRSDVRNRIIGLHVTGAVWNYEDNAWYAPLAEAWRITKLLDDPDFKGAIIDQPVAELIVEQAAMRHNLDVVALKLEKGERASDQYRIKLNGHELRPFQELSVEFLDTANGRVLLAHEMGLGKTWIFIAYAIFKGFERVVAVVPASLKPNWSREIEKLTGERPFVLSGRLPQMWQIQHILTAKPRFIIINYDIVGAAIDLPVEGSDPPRKKKTFLWADVINTIKPDLIGLDEAHYIKNMDSNRSQAVRKLRAPHIIPMTGTPVVNRPPEYFPALHLLNEDLFKHYEQFVQDYTFDGKRPRNVEQLKELLRPMMLRYTHEQVHKDLPPINRIRRYIELSPESVARYRQVLRDHVWKAVKMWDTRGREENHLVTHVLTEILRLLQVCSEEKASDTADLAREIYESQFEEDDIEKKVIIFTRFKAVAYAIAQELGEEAVTTVFKGDTDYETFPVEKRQEIVDKFQTDPKIHYIVTTIKAAAEGLTMTKGWAVVFNDFEWTPKDFQQAEGRARGRENDLHNIDSYTTVCTLPGEGEESESIESWMVDLLNFKEDVIEASVEGVEHSRNADESIFKKLVGKIYEQMRREGEA